MSKPIIKSIGTVIPLGDGATGKSLLTKHLIINNSISQEEIILLAQNTKKSLNVELEFSTRTIEFQENIINTTLQYYVFPGQRQKTSKRAPTFDEIVNVFEFLPSLNNVTVLLLLYDVTRLESLKSLEFWLKASIKRNWVSYKTKIILVCTKVDIKRPNKKFVNNVKLGIHNLLLENNIEMDVNQISSLDVSSITLEGIEDLKNEIFNWVAYFGLKNEF